MYVGGILYRLISDNMYNMVEESLSALHWFDDNRGHLPITLYSEPIDEGSVVELNAVSFTIDDIVSEEVEMGSNLTEHRFSYYIDVYGEGKSLAMHLAADIKDILQGRFSSIGRTTATFDVLDLTQEGKPILFFCEISDVQFDRNRISNSPSEKYWWTISCDIVYTYGDENSDY